MTVAFRARQSVDTDAPVLSSPTDVKTGSTTANLSVSTDEGRGTLYWIVSTSATQPTVAQIKAGQDHTGGAAADSDNQTVTATGAQNAAATGLSASTSYFGHFFHEDLNANQSNLVVADGFTTDSAADTTAPVLTSPTDTKTGETTASLSVVTDEGNGTLYWVVTQSATKPSKAQVKAGQDHTGSAADDSDSQAISSTGTKNASATGLTGSTAYFAHFMHEDAATNQSTVVSGDGFTTDAPAPGQPANTNLTTPGSGNYTIPAGGDSYTLTATVNGAGGGGGGGGGGYKYGSDGNDGTAGGQSAFNTTVLGNGGGQGLGGEAGDLDYDGANGDNGSAGTASGGDTNTTGGGAAGGAGGGGGGGGSGWGDGGNGGNGAAGGQAVKAYSAGTFSVGQEIPYTVGTRGSGGAGGIADFNNGDNGSTGTHGNVNLVWS